MKTELILVGGGGHCKSTIDVIEENGKFRIVGIVDSKEKVGQEVLGYSVIGSDEDLITLANEYSFFLVTVGQIKNFGPRLRIYELLQDLGVIMATIVSPRAHVSKHAKIGPGTVIFHGATVNAGAVVGENCIINTHALVEHDVIIGSHCHISTGAIVNGDVKIGDRTFVGSGSVLRQGVEVGNGCVLGARSLVLKDIRSDSIFKNGEAMILRNHYEDTSI